MFLSESPFYCSEKNKIFTYNRKWNIGFDFWNWYSFMLFFISVSLKSDTWDILLLYSFTVFWDVLLLPYIRLLLTRSPLQIIQKISLPTIRFCVTFINKSDLCLRAENIICLEFFLWNVFSSPKNRHQVVINYSHICKGQPLRDSAGIVKGLWDKSVFTLERSVDLWKVFPGGQFIARKKEDLLP